MRHVIHAALLAAICCGVAAAQKKPTAPRPLPAGKEARLWRQVEQELIAFEGNQMRADYRSRCGTRQPDAEFEALLAKCGFMQLPSPRHIEAVVNRAAHRGPLDPLMYWCAAEASSDLGPAKAWYQQAVDELQRVDAAPLVRLVVRTRARNRLGNDADPALLAGMAADMVACAGDPRMAGIGQRLLIVMFLEAWPGPDPAQRPLIDRMLAAKATDRYAALTIDGMCHIREAWAARSSKAASQVTQAGWKGFTEHLEAAAESLTAAHRLHPEFPEAPTKMIDVCGGSGAIKEIRGWFDAAVAAQFDYTDAYGSALHFYSVRWGGSRKLQLELGQECARTERFDTLVPQMLRNAIGMLANDTGKDLRDSFTEPLQRQLDAMHLRRIEHLTEVAAAQWELSQRAVELIMFRRTREGVELSQSIIGGLNWSAAETFGGVPKFVRRMIADHPVERTAEARLPVEMFAGHEQADYPGLTAARSLPVATTRPLQRDVDEQWSDLYAGLMQAQYRAHTEDPEPLRERAAAALTQFSQLLRGAEGAPSPTELNRTVTALAADGAADPLLAYCRGRCLEFDADLDAAVVAYEAARTGMARQGHAALFPYLALRRLASIATGRGDSARAEQLRVEASAQLRLAARMPEWRGDGRRHFASLAWEPERIPAYRSGRRCRRSVAAQPARGHRLLQPGHESQARLLQRRQGPLRADRTGQRAAASCACDAPDRTTRGHRDDRRVPCPPTEGAGSPLVRRSGRGAVRLHPGLLQPHGAAVVDGRRQQRGADALRGGVPGDQTLRHRRAEPVLERDRHRLHRQPRLRPLGLVGTQRATRARPPGRRPQRPTTHGPLLRRAAHGRGLGRRPLRLGAVALAEPRSPGHGAERCGARLRRPRRDRRDRLPAAAGRPGRRRRQHRQVTGRR